MSINKPSTTDFLSNSSLYRTPMSPSTLLLGKVKEEELRLLYKDPHKYRKNSKGRVLFWFNTLSILTLIFLVAYNGGVRSLDTFEDLALWQQIWSSSVPLWSILISNFGIILIMSLMIESKQLFIKFPKKPLVLLIIAVMSVSSFVLFLHPQDEVFYPGMLVVFFQNYNWVLLMVQPEDRLAHLMHPYLHVSNEKNNWLPFSFKAIQNV